MPAKIQGSRFGGMDRPKNDADGSGDTGLLRRVPTGGYCQFPWGSAEWDGRKKDVAEVGQKPKWPKIPKDRHFQRFGKFFCCARKKVKGYY